nr:hypothetical protein [Kibdelosporangium sp. MJ126-NF4]CTQ90792.1 hypothetical protein [Kibdelosporangium sp. MJ126-NF4]
MVRMRRCMTSARLRLIPLRHPIKPGHVVVVKVQSGEM